MLLVPAPAQLLEAREPVAPGLVVGREAARVRPHGVARPRPSSTVTTRVAVLSSSSRSWLMNRIVFADSRIRCSSQILPGTSRKLSGSSSSSTSSGPRSRNSSTSRFCSPPDSVREVAVLRPVVGHARAPPCSRRPRRPRCRSRRRRRTRPAPRRSASGSARRRRPSAPARRRSTSPPRPRAPAAARPRAAGRRRSGLAEPVRRPSGASRRGRRERVTAPACGARSPVMIRSSVVLPAPLAPTRATLAPSPTRNDTSSSSTRPSGSS